MSRLSPSADAALAMSHLPSLSPVNVSTVVSNTSPGAFGKKLRNFTTASRSMDLHANLPRGS